MSSAVGEIHVCRTGYLFDAFAVSGRRPAVFTDLLVSLRQVRIPTQVDSLLRELRARGEKRAGLQRPVVLAITQPLVITDSVPLAAVLLEYPVAYVPADADQTEFLPGVLLDVYHCVISLADTTLDDTRGAPGDAREHTLLKFSCPACLAEQDTSLSPARMMDRLRVSFGARLNAAEGQWNLAVRHTTEAHDRVSL
ncbi:hypothetical protein EVJ58_g820 [Rhodofomes roseus]|uniref:Uncharacterized protein n=1 Tax=Rhodofomes roseus TaxID=34475 RepID=A0A4Y9Z2J1_9APHY|nr:hypothetical protein EVJ58_g820 [Rhodofomes roseus]